MTRVGRNSPCPCGSGRKYKKCCINKLPRQQCIYIGCAEPFQAVLLGEGPPRVRLASTEEVTADASFSQIEYVRRVGKNKVLLSLPCSEISNTPASSALCFDSIWVIDTNTQRIGERAVSVACVFECYPRPCDKPQDILLLYRENGYIVFRDCEHGMAERGAWAILVKTLLARPTYCRELTAAIVTDHDLANHASYNAGDAAIFRESYLPANFTLVYVSADKPQDHPLNMLISRCDRNAARVLADLRRAGTAVVGKSTIALDEIREIL